MIICFRFPSDAKVAVIGGVAFTDEETADVETRWRREKDGSIVAWYDRHIPLFPGYTHDDLEVCMKVLEESKKCRLRREEENDIVGQALERFGARSGAAI